MEDVAFQLECSDLLIGDFQAGRIKIRIDPCPYLQSCLGAGGSDQVDDDLVSDQRFGSGSITTVVGPHWGGSPIC